MKITIVEKKRNEEEATDLSGAGFRMTFEIARAKQSDLLFVYYIQRCLSSPNMPVRAEWQTCDYGGVAQRESTCLADKGS